MSTVITPAVSQSEVDVRTDFDRASPIGSIVASGDMSLRFVQGEKNVWIVIALHGNEIGALRVGPHAGTIGNVQLWSRPDDSAGVELTTSLGGMRARVQFVGRGTLRCTISLLPESDTVLAPSPRDVLMLASTGIVYTQQRGLRSGIVFAGSRGALAYTMLYLQNFSALSEFFRQTEQTPADTVGGSWPEIGFALPAGDGRILRKANEVVISDAYITVSAEAPTSEEAIAGLYLDLFADTYLALERPVAQYHPWHERAESTLRDLTLSPECTYERQGRRFLMPYVGDTTKPPESMVQFTAAVNVREYDAWRGRQSLLEELLRGTAPAFFSDEIGTVVRWLPGETFDAAQADDNMNHEAMDSWYLHHSLFNIFRFAEDGDAAAKGMFEKSLPYIMRVARRFNYRWPIFFNLKTLDIIRAEAEPGQGGEKDVAGLYALVMIHAYEAFGNEEYLHEAEVAAAHLHGFGFSLAYQLNTTGFAAEAALRLWKITGKRRYVGLAELCLANLFDNMWLWQCDYGHALHYPTFFGLFPLRDAPYMAPYEELEAHAKFYEFLALGGDDVRPSLRLLIAEFQKYSLHRCWYYYPDALPIDAISGKVRNGSIQRSLSVPLEDLQDGREQSGQVGQELYGAGLPFVLTARHLMKLADGAVLAYCNYPMFDFSIGQDGTATWRAGGDPRCTAELRIFLRDAEQSALAVSVWTRAGESRMPMRGRVSAEGHAVFSVRGGHTVEIVTEALHRDLDSASVVIGPFAAQRADGA